MIDCSQSWRLVWCSLCLQLFLCIFLLVFCLLTENKPQKTWKIKKYFLVIEFATFCNPLSLCLLFPNFYASFRTHSPLMSFGASFVSFLVSCASGRHCYGKEMKAVTSFRGEDLRINVRCETWDNVVCQKAGLMLSPLVSSFVSCLSISIMDASSAEEMHCCGK